MRSCCTALAAVSLFVGAATAQQPLSALDFGRVCCTALDVAPGQLKDTTKFSDTKNYVFRARVITLDAERSMHLVFDTEMLRVAGVWSGKPLNITSQKTMGPAIDGTMLFATKPGPGWSVDGKWTDPRPAPEGPLPHAVGRYKGMYRHDEGVILSYTVGDSEILDMPTGTNAGGTIWVMRNFRLGPSKLTRIVRMFEDPTVRIEKSMALGGARQTEVNSRSGTLIASIRGGTGKEKWSDDQKSLDLHIPPTPKETNLRVSLIWPKGELAFRVLAEDLKAEPIDLTRLTLGGSANWPEELRTQGRVSDDTKSPYVADVIELPGKNPWGASIRFGGVDFFDDGRAALCTWDGDVWIVSGLDAGLKDVKWRRFAAGLHQPLGLRVVKGIIHVAGRDQITKLHDLNGDGEADFYENFNNDGPLTLQRHEFVMGLETDAEGNFYYCRSGHYILSKKGKNCCVMKVSRDGRKLEVFARGLREPNGLSIGPDGTMTVADNEGNGIPQTPIYRLLPGRDYGFTPPANYQVKEKPIVWLPPTVDRSAGGQVWAPKNWGPFGGQLLHTSYGSAALFSVLIDKSDHTWQGAVWRFPTNFTSGVMRARFSPADGQLYVCGLRGWDTNGTRDGDFSRIRFTGMKSPVPVGIEVLKNAIAVEFSDKLDNKSAQDDQNWACEWNTGPVVKKASLKEMPIERIRLAADGRTVTLELEESERMRSAPNYSLRYRIRASDGSLVTGALHGTIHGSR